MMQSETEEYMLKWLAIVFCVLLACVYPVSAATPDLAAGVYINDGAAPLMVGLHSAPTVTDWNNDGLKDLVVGCFSNGYVTVFINQGSDTNPLFDGGGLLQSGGTDITTSYG